MSDVMLDKIRKLLAKAEDPACTTAEAEAFTVKAAELIAKYGVDRALLAADDPDSDAVGDLVIAMPAPYAADKCNLLAGVAGELRCRSIRRQDGRVRVGESGFSMHLFGFRSDLDRVDLLFTSLLVQAGQALAVAKAPPWENLAAFRRSWLAGYTFAIVRRLREAETRAAQARSAEERAASRPGTAGRSVALVLADRSAHVEKALADAYPHVRFLGPRRLSGSGRDQGYAAGQSADLGGTKINHRAGGRQALRS